MTRIRQPDEAVICIGGKLRGKKDCTNAVEKFQGPRWDPFTPIQGARSNFGAISYQGEVYVLGGHDGQDALDTVEILRGPTWRWGRKMPVATESMAVCCVGGYIYSIGGCGDNQLETTNVYRLNVVKGDWEKMKGLEVPRVCHIACVVQGNIIVAGGMQRKDKHFRFLKSTECYRIVNNQWVSKMPTLRRRGGAGAVVIENEIYLVGGRNSEGYCYTIEVFDLDHNIWREAGKTSIPRAFAGVAIFQDRIVVAGGSDRENDAMALVESYNPVTQEWETLKPMRQGKQAPYLVAVKLP